MMADGSLLRSGGETWGPVSPTMFSKQVSRPVGGWIPHRGRRGVAGRANSKKDLVTGAIRVFCALHPREPGSAKGALSQIMPLTWEPFLLPAMDRHPSLNDPTGPYIGSAARLACGAQKLRFGA